MQEPNCLETREHLILGHPPRIEAVRSDDNIRTAQEQVAKLRGATQGDASLVPVEAIPEMIIALMCHPELYQRVAGVSIQLLGSGALPARERELVVLRTGWLCQAPYEWGEHVRMAKREGVSEEEIQWVVEGSCAAGWHEQDRALLQATEELHTQQMISDATWNTLAKTLSEKQLFELTVLVGQFTTVAYFQNSLRFRLSEGNDGLKAR